MQGFPILCRRLQEHDRWSCALDCNPDKTFCDIRHSEVVLLSRRVESEVRWQQSFVCGWRINHPMRRRLININYVNLNDNNQSINLNTITL